MPKNKIPLANNQPPIANSQELIPNSQQPIANSQSPIPYGKQHITQADIDAVIETLTSDFLTQGPKIAEFEYAFSQYVGSKYALAVANGTAALHLCALALGVKPGEKVITTPITFAASANCVRYCGGEVVFADIDPETYLLDINNVRALLEASPKGTYKGIIPVDFAGRAANLEAFRKLADEFGCWIIEDACHAPGGFFIDSKGQQQNCGNGAFADLAIFSFHPVKHIACGEGGMITTNNENLYKKLLTLRTHGITRDSSLFQNTFDFASGQQLTANSQELTANSQQPTANYQPPTANRQPPTANRQPPTANSQPPIANHQPPTANRQWPNWYMEMQTLGYNYRLTDFQAALGLSQLQRADEGLDKRKSIANKYHEAFKNLPQITDRNYEAITANSQTPTANSQPPTANRQQLTANSQTPINGHAYHLYIIEVKNRFELYNYLRSKNIFAQIHYIPCHLMPYYRQFGWKEGDMPNAENYYKGCISLPMYPTLTEEEQQYVIESILAFSH
jgi:dTDP-4-amino-4,6-dideoxygalactose transaminase